MRIQGTFDSRFAAVAEAMSRNFREHDEVGAAVAVAIDGKPVVDIWAGWEDAARTRHWRRETIVDVFSLGKPMAALSLTLLMERGLVDLDAPVARYWPEFGAAGKEDVTVRMVLSHRAGVPGVRAALPAPALYDWESMTSALAAEAPWWEPGTAHGYHVNTLGFLIGEIVRRVSGETLRAFFDSQVAGPLDADFHFGTARRDGVADFLFPGPDSVPNFEARMTDLLLADLLEGEPPSGLDEDELRLRVNRVYLNPPGISGFGTVNTDAWRAALIPSANGHATARGVARIFAALGGGGALNGIRVVEPETIEIAIAEASSGLDVVLGRPTRFGLGFMLTQPERRFGPNPRTFGHLGAGGSLAFADPDVRLAFAYVMNQPGPRWQNPRNRALIDAVYASL
jgi:CubicO group peptidase (beta-lactamase class C family)